MMPVFLFYSIFGKMLENSADIWYYINVLVFAIGGIAMVVSYNRLFKLIVDKISVLLICEKKQDYLLQLLRSYAEMKLLLSRFS